MLGVRELNPWSRRGKHCGNPVQGKGILIDPAKHFIPKLQVNFD
jgi:hypothetical protein